MTHGVQRTEGRLEVLVFPVQQVVHIVLQLHLLVGEVVVGIIQGVHLLVLVPGGPAVPFDRHRRVRVSACARTPGRCVRRVRDAVVEPSADPRGRRALESRSSNHRKRSIPCRARWRAGKACSPRDGFFARRTSFTRYVSHYHSAVNYARGCSTHSSLVDATPAHQAPGLHFTWQGVSKPQQKQLQRLIKNFPSLSKPHMSMSLSKKA